MLRKKPARELQQRSCPGGVHTVVCGTKQSSLNLRAPLLISRHRPQRLRGTMGHQENPSPDSTVVPLKPTNSRDLLDLVSFTGYSANYRKQRPKIGFGW
jgi:hypothetical protein